VIFSLRRHPGSGLFTCFRSLSGYRPDGPWAWSGACPRLQHRRRRQKTLRRDRPTGQRHHLLDLLVTPIKFLAKASVKCKKHGAEYRRQWRKVSGDGHPLEIGATEVTDNSAGD
jgi:hypothetical protein